jgi:hypothetical protein
VDALDGLAPLVRRAQLELNENPANDQNLAVQLNFSANLSDQLSS